MPREKKSNTYDMNEEIENNKGKPSNDRRKKQSQKRQIDEALDEYYEQFYSD
jgi:hypothetical protein